MKKIIVIILFGLFLIINTSAQNAQKPCSQSEAKQFDFWVGTWDLEWKTSRGEMQNGTNTVKKILGGCVIQENFSGGEKMPLRGMSHSVYDERAKTWKQTWVDNSGAYLDFVGEFKDGKMIFKREILLQDGKKILQRMLFYNITKDALDWHWEGSKDEGKTWDVFWKIHYARKRKSQASNNLNKEQNMIQGLRTVIYHVDDLEKAKQWYSKILGIEPYFDEPFYVGFNVGGFELGLDPDMNGISKGIIGNSVVAYWGVKNIKAEYKRILEVVAEKHSDIEDVGGGIRKAEFKRPVWQYFRYYRKSAF